jgi:hypothetical protein
MDVDSNQRTSIVYPGTMQQYEYSSFGISVAKMAEGHWVSNNEVAKC